MALPTTYMTGGFTKINSYFDTLMTAKAPEKFTIKFLENLGFKSSTDRLFINVLKMLGFLDDTGSPTSRYFDFLDQSKSKLIVADGIKEAYSDLFELNVNAYQMQRSEVEGKFKTLTEGKKSQTTIQQMVSTFMALCAYADWSQVSTDERDANNHDGSASAVASNLQTFPTACPEGKGLDLNYDIHIHLPATRDPAVYDALFSSLAKHIPLK